MAEELDFPNRRYHEHADKLALQYTNMVQRIQSELNDFFVLMDKTYFLLTAALLDHPIDVRLPNLDVYQLLLTRAMKTYRSISLLLMNGHDQDALALLRNLCETAVTLKHIHHEDTNSRAKKFRDFLKVEHFKRLVNYKKAYPETYRSHFSPGEIDRIESDMMAYRKEHGYKDNEDVKNWAGVGMKKMSFDLGMKTDYVHAFSMYCAFTHSTYLSLESYGERKAEGMLIAWHPSTKHVPPTVFIATDYLLSIVETYLEFGKVKDLDWLLTEIRHNLGARSTDVGHEVKLPYKVKIEKGTWGELPSFEKIVEELKQQEPSGQSP